MSRNSSFQLTVPEGDEKGASDQKSITVLPRGNSERYSMIVGLAIGGLLTLAWSIFVCWEAYKCAAYLLSTALSMM